MKKTTCKDLRGACDAIILGETPEEMGENSKKHVMEMIRIPQNRAVWVILQVYSRNM